MQMQTQTRTRIPVFDETADAEQRVLCPTCGDSSCHISGVAVMTATQQFDVFRVPPRPSTVPVGMTSPAIDCGWSIPANEAGHLRGAAVQLRCYCESGHVFNVFQRFHKGEILFASTPTGERINPGVEPHVDLWRD